MSYKDPQRQRQYQNAWIMKRHCEKLDRYYARCQRVANGHHSKFPHEKRYNWLIRQEHRNGMQGDF